MRSRRFYCSRTPALENGGQTPLPSPMSESPREGRGVHVTFSAATHLPDALCGGASSSPKGVGGPKGHYPRLHAHPVTPSQPIFRPWGPQGEQAGEVPLPWPHRAASGCLHGGCSARSSPLAQSTSRNVSHLAEHQHLGDEGPWLWVCRPAGPPGPAPRREPLGACRLTARGRRA